jgi:hypothetical protein
MMKNFISDSEIVYLKILTEDLTAKRRTVEWEVNWKARNREFVV